MGSHGKALVYRSKALPISISLYYDKAMLSTSEILANKLAIAMADAKLSGVDVAKACGVTKQAVQGWKSTGRIDKRHLPALSMLSGKPLWWWLDLNNTDPAPDNVIPAIEPRKPETQSGWPFSTVTPEDYARLSDTQRVLVEGFIKGMLVESRSVKRKAAA